MVVVGEHNVNPILDINDDLARETAFYERALASAEVAVGKLKALGVAVRRPDDFYAEMVKSDEHMKRVRAELIFEQTSMETKDERRKAREQKRYGKQVQAEKLKERTLQKKESISKLDKFRKQRKRDGFEDNGKAPDGFEEEGPEKKKRQTGGGGSTDEARPKPGIKRISRRTSLDSGGGSGYVFFFFSTPRDLGVTFFVHFLPATC
jgi:rRNA-processing protein EBP2